MHRYARTASILIAGCAAALTTACGTATARTVTASVPVAGRAVTAGVPAATPDPNATPASPGGSVTPGPWVSAALPRPDAPAHPRKPDPRSAPLANATIDLPALPHPEADCPTGAVSFAKGVADNAGQDTQWWIDAADAVWAEVDGRPGVDTLVDVSCQGEGSLHLHYLLAITVAADGSVTTIGNVLPGDHGNLISFNATDVRVAADRTVTVESYGLQYSDGGPREMTQARAYRYDGSGFSQVGGPTVFQVPPSELADVDFRNTTIGLPVEFEPDGGLAYDFVAFADGRGGDIVTTSEGTVLASNYASGAAAYLTPPDGPMAIVPVTVTDDHGRTSQMLLAYTPDTDGSQQTTTYVVLRTGAGGVTSIERFRAVGTDVEIQFHTAAGPQDRVYHRSANGQTWSPAR
jgi:hypothetical protein